MGYYMIFALFICSFVCYGAAERFARACQTDSAIWCCPLFALAIRAHNSVHACACNEPLLLAFVLIRDCNCTFATYKLRACTRAQREEKKWKLGHMLVFQLQRATAKFNLPTDPLTFVRDFEWHVQPRAESLFKWHRIASNSCRESPSIRRMPSAFTGRCVPLCIRILIALVCKSSRNISRHHKKMKPYKRHKPVCC